MYIGVPTRAPDSVTDPEPVSRANPKSVTTTWPSGRWIMFAGLMSLCTMP
jgi:hypothetical protein